MSNKSLIDYAYEVLEASKEPIGFKSLFDKALELSKLELTDEEKRHKMSSLYTQLSLDGRFIILTDNNWDLRARHVYSQVHIDMDDAYSDDEGEEYDAEEAELLREELGEEDEKDEPESDDLDFDRVKTGSDTEENF